MKKKLYYTEKEEVNSKNKSLVGIKDVHVYEIVTNKPKTFFSLELSSEEDSKEGILAYLDDNGYGDDEYELTLL
jgi:hypothetical protein